MSEPFSLSVYRLARRQAQADGAQWALLSPYRRNRYIERAEAALRRIDAGLGQMLQSCPPGPHTVGAA